MTSDVMLDTAAKGAQTKSIVTSCWTLLFTNKIRKNHERGLRSRDLFTIINSERSIIQYYWTI